MRRLYFLIPDVQSARAVVDALHRASVPDERLHVVAEPMGQVRDAGLPEAGLMQRRDLRPALFKGVVAGGLTGTVVGMLLAWLQPAGLGLPLGTVLVLALVGALFGLLAAPMLGISIPNTRLRRFAGAIENGSLLLMVDVPARRRREITALVRSHHPEVEDRGVEASIPPLP